MEGYAYFPAVVYRDERPDLAEEVAEACLRQLGTISETQGALRQTGVVQHTPEFRNLANYVLLTSVDILREQGYAIDRYDFYISGLWVQEVSTHGSTNVHMHKNSQISGWLFVDVPENGAYPIYRDTRVNKAMTELDFVQGDEILNATNTIHFGSVQRGTVLFANSWVPHQLAARGEEPTRCVHFIVSHKDRPCSIC